MKRKIHVPIRLSILFIALLCCAPFAHANEPQGQKDEEEVRATFNRFWYGVRKINWQIVESSAHFPFTQMNVRFSDKVLVMNTPQELKAKFMNIRSYLDNGQKAELQQYHDSFVISQVQIIEDKRGFANVNFELKWGEKTPFKLVTSLRKHKDSWKVVFTQVPS